MSAAPGERSFARRSVGFLELSAIGYFVVAGITLYDIAARFLFARPTVWVLETSILICGLLFLLNCLVASLADAHIRIDAMRGRVARLVPPRILDLVALCASAIFLLGIGYGGVMQAMSALAAMETSGTVMNSYTPTILKVAIPLVAAGMGAALLWHAAGRPASRR